MFKKKYLLLTLFLIIIFQIFLYINNYQKASFRYFKWTIQEVSIGKLISFSFFSGLFMSTFLNNSFNSYKKSNHKNTTENEETLNNGENLKSNIEMPPQRDIRDAQPTISVNYRVVKNMNEKNLNYDQNYSNNPDKNDDWDNNYNDW